MCINFLKYCPKSVTVILWLASLLVAPVTVASTEMLQKAFDAYNVGQEQLDRDARVESFKRAQRLFEKVANNGGAGASLYSNLGIAALRSEDLGSAVLAFRQTLLISPSHQQARQNLEHARSLLPSWVPTPKQDSLLDSFFFWHRSIGLMDRSGMAAVAFLLAGCFVAVSIRWRQPVFRYLAFIPGCVWLSLLLSVGIEITDGKQHAVVIQDDVIARAADSNNAPRRFVEPLPSGTEVTVLDTRDQWARIALANGRDAWVSKNSLAVVTL